MGSPEPVRRPLGGGPSRLVRELGAFGVVGGTCFLVDIALFQLLYAHAGTGAVTAKLLSTLVSMSLAFLGHRFWSFAAHARTGLRREYGRFAVVNGTTLLVGLGIVAFVRHPLGQESALVLQLANVVSIAVGTVVRFLAYRRWVFPARAAFQAAVTSPDAGTGVVPEPARPLRSN